MIEAMSVQSIGTEQATGIQLTRVLVERTYMGHCTGNN